MERIVHFLDDYLQLSDFPDYPGALNGLQVTRRDPTVKRLVAAVDASEHTIEAAVSRGADLLLVHHGLFWGGLAPVTGRLHRKLSTLIREDVALYSAHLPLDGHPEVGNAAVLAAELGIPMEGPFGSYQGREVGVWGRVEEGREVLKERVAAAVGGPVRLIEGGPEEIRKVAIATGGGGSFIREAAERGMDALLTGEGAHHTYFDAIELGVNVLYAGHYATETWGVRALGERLARNFNLDFTFVDFPTGL